MPPMMVSVWGTQMRMTFAQTQAGEGGEAEAAIALLQRLSLKGCVVTADAIHCDRRTAETVKQRGGDYVFALKLNQRKLYASVAALSMWPAPAPSAETCEDGHGRHERRSILVVPAPGLARTWVQGLTTVARVVSERTIDGKTTREERLFIASRRFAPFDFLDIVRKHWDIENGSHWQQDVVFHEDLARNRKDNSPRNLALLRRLTANILNMTPDKASTRGKRLEAAWNEEFFLDALTHMR